MSDNPSSPICTRPAAVGDSHSLPGAFSIRRLLEPWPLAIGALTVFWLLLFNELRGEWEVNPQYNYGYVVPLLGAALLWRRWQERPSPSYGSSALVFFVAFGALFFLLPIRLILEANPEWRMAYWAHGFLVLTLSGCLLYRAGGWNWVKFFSPPLAFMLIAIPWPMELEQAVIQNLMRFVAGLTVEVAGLLGIPAIQHGNLIEVGNGVVGINEACSGVRSLQSALMLSLFLGEMHRFPAWRRIVLVGASFACVLFANLTRTTFLTWAAANRGLTQMESWHDTAGFLVMVTVLPILFGLAHLMKPKAPRVLDRSAGTAPALHAVPRWVVISAVVWMGIAEVATEAWYRTHERNLIANARWSVAWPAQDARFKKTTLPDESLAILRCSNSDSAAWEDDQGNQWSAFSLRWDAGKNSAALAKGHRPDICFPASGAKLVEDRGLVTVSAKGIELPFKYQTFESGPHLLHVFYCLWSDRSSPNDKTAFENITSRTRLRAVLAGQRNLGQQVLEITLQGPDSSDEAVAAFKQQIVNLIQRQSPPSSIHSEINRSAGLPTSLF